MLPSPSQIRIAYGIQVHANPQQFGWLYRAIYSTEDVYSIHIDQNTPDATCNAFSEVIGSPDNVIFLPRRRIRWGGWSLTSCALASIATLLEADKNWTHFINLSGSCYPLTPRQHRVDFLSDNPSTNFIQHRSVTAPSSVCYRFQWSYEETDDRVVNSRRRKPRPSGFSIDYGGEFWSVLSRPFCEWITSAPLANKIQQYFTDTFVSDEMIFQALLFNSPFRGTVGPFQWEVLWRDGSFHPETLTLEQTDLLLGSEKLFARKFDERIDSRILHILAEKIGAPKKSW